MTQRRPRSYSPNHNIYSSSSMDRCAKRPVPAEIIKKFLPEMTNVYPEMLCPICYETINDAHITQCGHTFCYHCIIQSIERYKKCPKCCTLINKDQVYKNILLNELIMKFKTKSCSEIERNKFGTENFKKYILTESENLSLTDTNHIIEVLEKHKQKKEFESSSGQNILLFEFLKKLLKEKENAKIKISQEINLIEKDLELVTKKIANYNPKIDKDLTDSSTTFNSFDEINNTIEINTKYQNDVLKLNAHFDDFVVSYFNMHSNNSILSKNISNYEINDSIKIQKDQEFDLETFREILAKCCKYSKFLCKATINSASDEYIPSNIVSSIVFNNDNTNFAIGGVTKKIKIYDLNLVQTNMAAFQYPLLQIILSNKISCLAWNMLHKNLLASSDYEGIVNIWDVDTSARTRCFNEHEKRCWSVDFNGIDPNLIISGSDDNKVKLWSIKENHSIRTVETKANVCCVKFKPNNLYHFVFGSADHCVYYYDLRNMKNHLSTFKGHKKAVSYVKFLNTNEIISASTDSQLKYWNINSPNNCLRSFKGHLNEKNFVGLTINNDYIGCGSEDNSVYIYYKEMSKHLFNYKINTSEEILNLDRLNDTNDFVSAVCWKENSEIMLAANSRGIIKVLELI